MRHAKTLLLTAESSTHFPYRLEIVTRLKHNLLHNKLFVCVYNPLSTRGSASGMSGSRTRPMCEDVRHLSADGRD